MTYPQEKRLKILMLGPELNVQGGISTVERLLLEHWPQERHSLRFIGTLVDGSYGAKMSKAFRAYVQFLAALISYRPNILYIHFASRASFYRKAVFVLIGTVRCRNIVLHSHGGEFHIFYEQESNKWQKSFIRFVLNRARSLIVVSSQWREFYRKIYGRFEPTVIHNAVSYPNRVAGLTKPPPIVLYLGRLTQSKGTYDLIKAFPYILEKTPAAQLWLCGDGEVEQVTQLINQHSWGKQVRLLGWVTGELKEQVLQQSWLLALPSYNEGLPLAILEAMAYGLPVISTPVGGIPEAVVDGVTGYLVTPGDVEAISEKAQQLLTDQELLQRMGKAARRRIQEHFEVKRVIEQIISVFEAL